jgi:hypothetical protein
MLAIISNSEKQTCLHKFGDMDQIEEWAKDNLNREEGDIIHFLDYENEEILGGLGFSRESRGSL